MHNACMAGVVQTGELDVASACEGMWLGEIVDMSLVGAATLYIWPPPQTEQRALTVGLALAELSAGWTLRWMRRTVIHG